MTRPSLAIDRPPDSYPRGIRRLTTGLSARIGRADLLGLSFLFVLALLILARPIILGGTVDNSDILLQSIPVYSWYGDSLRQGNLPIWSPAILGGFPLAFAQYGFFYPPDMLLFWLLDASRAFHLSLALHLALAGGATYWYCRVLGLRRVPSLLAAVAFQMGTEALAWPVNGFLTKTLFTLPALLATVELTLQRSTRYWLLIPLIVGAGLLVGYAQFVAVALLVAGAYLLVAVAARRAVVWPAPAAHAIALFGLGAITGVGLAAIRVLPTVEMTELSVRSGGLSFADATVELIQPVGLLLGSLVPAIFESSVWLDARPDYVGAPALVLAILALVSVRSLGYPGRFHAGLAVTSAVFSLGQYTPVYGVLFQLPLLSYFRAPGRLSVVTALALAVLAAYALDRGVMARLPGWRRQLSVTAIIGLAVVSGLAVLVIGLRSDIILRLGGDAVPLAVRQANLNGNWEPFRLLRVQLALPLIALSVTLLLVGGSMIRAVSLRTLEWGMLIVSATVLLSLGWLQNPWISPDTEHQPPAFLESLKSDQDFFRVFAWAPGAGSYNAHNYFANVVGHQPSPDFEARYTREFLQPNSGMLYGLSAFDGYEVMQSRRQALLAAYMGSERQEEMVRDADGQLVDDEVKSRALPDRLDLLAALNVRYLTSGTAFDDPRLDHIGHFKIPVYADREDAALVELYRVKDALPRAWVVPTATVATGEAETLGALSGGAVDVRQTVLLEQQAPALQGPSLTPEGSRVQIERYGDDQVALSAQTDGSGFLVLMDFLLPGWHATVDGILQPVMAGNFAGRAVPIQGPGDHSVVFSYEAPLFREGLLLSLATLALLVAFALSPRLSRAARSL